MPTAYLPDEDQGVLFVQAMLPANSTLEQTEKILGEVRDYFLVKEKDAVESVMAVAGYSFAGRGQNVGLAFVKLRDWGLRDRPDLRADVVARRAMGAFSKIRSAMVFAFPPPAVIEMGHAKGFDFHLQDRGGLGHAKLSGSAQSAPGNGHAGPEIDQGPSQRPGRRSPSTVSMWTGRRRGRWVFPLTRCTTPFPRPSAARMSMILFRLEE